MRHRGRCDITTLQLAQQGAIPLYRQIYIRIRDGIAGGTLPPSSRLPSSRSLASQLLTARGTVDLAYSLLASEGYLVCRGAAGTYIAPTLAASGKSLAINRASPGHQASEKSALSTVSLLPFQMGLPALDAFPFALWSRLAVRQARSLSIQSMIHTDTSGYTPLRNAIASYLLVSRGVHCSAEQVFITAGLQGALGLITRAFLDPGDEVWFEEPGYFEARSGLSAAGAKLVPVAVDCDGMDVADGLRRAPQARMVYVTPSHQAPLGVTMSLPRRLALLAWARKARSWIIEDDYDGEFRYESRPLPALKSLDAADRVLYVGSFSKVLFPGLRLGYLVVPTRQVERVREVSRWGYSTGSILSQAVVADFMHAGHFGRHIKKMRILYATRRTALATALTHVFANRAKIELQAGGMHLLARFADSGNDIDLVTKAKAAGLAPVPLSVWSHTRSRKIQGLLLSFTNAPPQSSLALATRLKRAIDGASS